MKLTIFILLSVYFLSGCENSSNTEARVSDGYGGGDVKLIMLEDGTRCAVLIGYKKGGIDCDWKR